MTSETALRSTRDQKLIDDWALVLVSQGLSPSIGSTQDGLVLSVPDDQVERAVAGLSAYDNENSSLRQDEISSDESLSFVPGLIVAGTLVASHFIIMRWSHIAPWFERGSADAGRVLSGELWRVVTALTLHVDLGHVLSNAVTSAIFITVLSSVVGPGLSAVLFVVAGAGGNLTNAFVQGSGHVAVGASTSIFGIIGAIGALGTARRRQRSIRRRRAWVSIAAALALLAMLGTGTGRIDVLAHFFGFLFGAVVGVVLALSPRRRTVQWIYGSVAIILVTYCWILALS